MFDTLLESRTVGAQVRSRWAFPIAVMSHVTLIGTLIAGSLLVTVSLKEPASPIIFADIAAVPIPPPPPVQRGSATTAPATQEPREAERVTEEPLQPELIPEQANPIDETDATGSGEGEGTVVGVPDGDPHGDPNGVLGGVPDGVGPPNQPTGIVIVTPDMTPPVLKRKVEPEYPEAARVIRLQGRVLLQAVISATGHVEEVTVLRSSSPLFEEAALEAVRQWEYEPARQGPHPVAVYFTIDVRFTLR